MVETPGTSYKDKYLQALDDIERADKRHAYQLDLLRKTLINLSAAALGLDKNLDTAMRQLKESLRGGSGPQVVRDMEVLQEAVKQFEAHRNREHASVAEKMQQCLQPYSKLQLSGDLRDKLHKFSQGLTSALNNYRAYPRVLTDLLLLQDSALKAAMNPSASLWQRLRGGNTLQSAYANTTEAGRQEPFPLKSPNLQLAPEDNIKPEHNIAPSLAGMGADPAQRQANNLLDEDSYEKVAGRIALTLRELVENIEPNDVVRHRVDLVRARIERGMDWYALSVTLEDIRDILMQRYLDVDREFSQYLQDVNRELSEISDVLGVALKREAEVNAAATSLSDAVTEEVGKIQTTVAQSTGLDSLKRAVNSHLDIILDALRDYHKVQEGGKASLSNELNSLLEKVASFERESSKTREMLEAERHRATHDALTGLPNREAYNERAFHELQRFQRYGHNLSLAVCDIDHFKHINDNYGHQAGDKVLKLIAKVVSTRLRKVDFVARFGGEEFVILMPETSPTQAQAALDKIRQVVAEAAFRFRDSPVSISISFGITGFIAEDSVEEAFDRADRALYRAKAEGRNRCVLSDAGQNEA